MKRLIRVFILFIVLGQSLIVFAYEPPNRDRLKDDIDQLKSKIRSSKDINNKDLQKLTELENQLHKNNFLDKSKDSNRR